MANVVIASNAESMKFTFNDLAPVAQSSVVSMNRNEISIVCTPPDDSYVVVILRINHGGFGSWQLSFDGANGLEVDTVDGAAPSSNPDLRNKIAALMLH